MPPVADFARRYVQQFRDDDVPGLGAELAFRFLFAVFPFGIFATALGAVVAGLLGVENPAQKAIEALADNLPAELAGAVQDELQAVIEESRPELLSVGAFGALYAATGGTLALIKAMNRAFDIREGRGFVGRIALAVGLTLLLALGLLAAFVTIVGGTVVTQELAERIGFSSQAWALVDLLRWPVVFAMLVAAVTILFRLAPDVAAPWRWIVAGAVIFAVGWLVTTFAFALYVANVANYASTYGALGGVIALMLWFYLTAIVLVGSAELVALGTNATEPERTAAKREGTAVGRAARRLSETTTDGARDIAGGAREALTPDDRAEPRATRAS